ncbi:hypothetical protein [Paenibacillus sp. NPDC058174]|uniref:hypothetical protein n=1 Tax=Paenibacillus sp. NPDC058174 TaxID=3346366 RepID=UPI0036D96E55
MTQNLQIKAGTGLGSKEVTAELNKTLKLYEQIAKLRFDNLNKSFSELNKQMNELKGTIQGFTSFESILQRSIAMLNNLGQTISTINHSRIEIAIEGFDERYAELSATAAQNVPSMPSSEAIDAITTALAALNKEGDKSASFFDHLSALDSAFSIATAVKDILGFTGVLNIATLSVAGLKAALKGLALTTGVGAILTVISFAADKLINSFAKSKDSSEAFEQSLTTLSDRMSELVRLRELQTEYQNLAQSLNLTSQEKSRLSKVEEELGSKYGVVFKHLGDQKEAYDSNNRAIQQRVDLLNEEIRLEREKLSLEYHEDESSIDKNIKKNKKKVEKNKQAYDQVREKYDEYKQNVEDKKVLNSSDYNYSDKYNFFANAGSDDKLENNKVKMIGEELARQLNDAREKFQTSNTELQKVVKIADVALKADFASYVEAMRASGVEVKNTTSLMFDALASTASLNGIKLDNSQLRDFFDVVNTDQISNLEDARMVFRKLPESIGLNEKAFNDLNVALTNLSYEDAKNGTNAFKEVLDSSSGNTERLREAYASSANDIKKVNQAIHDLNSGQLLSSETVADLILKYPELAAQSKQVAGGWEIETKALEKVRKEENERFLNKVKGDKEITQSTINSIRTRIKLYEVELETLQKFTSKLPSPFLGGTGINNVINPPTVKKLPSKSELEEKIQLEKDKLKIEEDKLNTQLAQIDTIEKTFNDKNFGVSSSNSSNPSNPSKSSSSQDNDLPRLQDATQARINAMNKLADEQKKQNEKLKAGATIAANSGDYMNAILNANKLYAGQTAEINNLTSANYKLVAAQKEVQKSNQNDMSEWIDDNGEATEDYIKLFNKTKSGSAQDALQKQFDQYKMLTMAIRENRSEREKLYQDLPETSKLMMEYIKASSDSLTSKAERKISLLGSINTQEEKNKLVKYSEEISNALKQENNRIWAEIAKFNKIINDPKASADLKAAAKQSLEDYKNYANELNLERVTQAEKSGQIQADAIVFGFNKKIEDLQYRKSLLGNSEEDVKKAKQIDAEMNQVRLAAQAKFNAQIIELERKLTTDLTETERMRVQTKLDGLREANKAYAVELANYQKAEYEAREKFADTVINNYKKVLEQERKLREDALKAEKKAEDDRHETVMKNLDEELSGYEKQINAKIKALDINNSEEDHNEQLDKLLKEKAAIDNKISVLALDDSFEAKAKRKTLEEELALKNEEIVKFQRDRERQLKKEGLQDQLDDRKATIEQEKKAEDEKNKSNIKNIEQLIEKNNLKYKGLLEDEQSFYQMKQDLMSGDTAKIQSQLSIVNEAYGQLYKNILANSELYGEMINQNLINAFKLDQDYANSGAGIPKNTAKQSAWQEYLNNKKEAEDLGSKKDGRFQELAKRNAELREIWKFQDGKYESLKDVKVFHEGGEVGEEGTSTQKWWDRLKNDEVPSILRKGEVVLDNPLEFISRMARNAMSNLGNSLNFINSAAPAAAANYYSVNIDKVMGDEKGARMVTDYMLDALNKMNRKGKRV